MVEELLDNSRLVVMNDSRPTRFDINNLKMSCLDLTIAFPTLAQVGEWDVLGKQSMGSDHFPVLSQFGRSLIVVQGDLGKRFDFSRAEWGKFGVEIGKSLGEINSEGSIDEFNDSLSKMIFDVALRTIPCRGVPKDRVIVPWWNSDCDKAVKERKQAFKLLRSNPTQRNSIHFKRCRAKARKIIKDAKKKVLERFLWDPGSRYPWWAGLVKDS